MWTYAQSYAATKFRQRSNFSKQRKRKRQRHCHLLLHKWNGKHTCHQSLSWDDHDMVLTKYKVYIAIYWCYYRELNLQWCQLNNSDQCAPCAIVTRYTPTKGLAHQEAECIAPFHALLLWGIMHPWHHRWQSDDSQLMEVDLIKAAAMALPSSSLGEDSHDGIAITLPPTVPLLAFQPPQPETVMTPTGGLTIEVSATKPSTTPRLTLTAWLIIAATAPGLTSHQQQSVTKEPIDRYHWLPICCHHPPLVCEPHLPLDQNPELASMGVVPKATTLICQLCHQAPPPAEQAHLHPPSPYLNDGDKWISQEDQHQGPPKDPPLTGLPHLTTWSSFSSARTHWWHPGRSSSSEVWTHHGMLRLNKYARTCLLKHTG